MTADALIVFVGALAGGLISGLTGFGTGLIALPIWLNVIPLFLGAPLVAICSIAAQLQTLPAIVHAINLRRLAPFVAGGALGVPCGTWLLSRVSVDGVRIALGLLLSVVCATLLAMRRRPPLVTRGGRLADGLVGLGGGLLGGLAGLSGPLPTIWAGLRGWGKDERRAVFQGFNLTVLLLALTSQAVAGYVTKEVGLLALVALPGTFAGAAVGKRLYSRLDTAGFNDIVLGVLFVAGLGTVVSALT